MALNVIISCSDTGEKMTGFPMKKVACSSSPFRLRRQESKGKSRDDNDKYSSCNRTEVELIGVTDTTLSVLNLCKVSLSKILEKGRFPHINISQI